MSKLLIVEENRLVASRYSDLFQKEGYGVRVVGDGQEALDCLLQDAPDLVLLDLHLTKVNGLEVLRQIRARTATQALPVIMLTNAFDIEMARAARRAGANRLISKSEANTAAVVELVRSSLGTTPGRTAPSGAESSHPSDPSPVLQLRVQARRLKSLPGAQAVIPTDTIFFNAVIGPTPTAAVAPVVVPAAPAALVAPVAASVMARAPGRIPRPKEVSGGKIDVVAQWRDQFVARANALSSPMRAMVHGFVKDPNPVARLERLKELGGCLHSLSKEAASIGLGKLEQFSRAFEDLLRELASAPEQITPFVQRNVTKTVDFLLAALPHTPLLETRAPAKSRILVVDDDPVACLTICFALGRAQLSATTAESGPAALRILETESFDLIFMDISMPGMDGIEACRRLRAFPHHKKTPVIFVTSRGDLESRTQSVMSGGNEFVSKPFIPMDLTLKALMRLWQAQLAAMQSA